MSRDAPFNWQTTINNGEDTRRVGLGITNTRQSQNKGFVNLFDRLFDFKKRAPKNSRLGLLFSQCLTFPSFRGYGFEPALIPTLDESCFLSCSVAVACLQ